jgi:hypothetical protein
MTKRNYIQFSCNYCGSVDEYTYCGRGHSRADNFAKIDGWIIVNKKHFCSKQCYQNYKKQVATAKKLKPKHLKVKQLVKMLSKLDQEKEICYQHDSSVCSLYWLEIYDQGYHYLMYM